MDIEFNYNNQVEYETIMQANRKVSMERIFWPVGHGAFYTERFPLEDGTFFTVAYDCGTSNSQDILETQINKCIDVSDHIDILFISHFHKDHISGVEDLLKRGVVRRIFLPVIAPECRAAILLFLKAYETKGFLYDIVENPVEAIRRVASNKELEIFFVDVYEEAGKRDNSGEGDPREKNFRKEAPTIRSGRNKYGSEKDEKLFLNGTKYAEKWEYIPYNIPVPGIVDELINEFRKDYNNIKNIYDVYDQIHIGT